MQQRILAGAVAGALVIGGVGTALILPRMAEAADPSASPTATSVPTATSAPTTTPGVPSGSTGNGGPGGHGGSHGGPGGLDADDLTAAAKALGMTEADLTTALNGGKSAAQVAQDKGVDVQQVIDAVVASDKAEFAAAVKAGTMTQAQADRLLANLSAHVTDEVNGVAGGPGGPGGHGGLGPDIPAPTSGTSGSGTTG